MPTLNQLISIFDIPLPDDQFPDLVVSLGDEARKRVTAREKSQSNGTYFYLLARTYELLGYCSRHTPWLSQSPKFYWQWAAGFFEQARESTGLTLAQYHFLDGKFLLRTGMIHTLDRKSAPTADGYERLAKATIAFEEAARAEQDPALQLIYQDAGVIAKTEAQQRKIVDEILGMFLSRTAPWPKLMEQIDARVRLFPTQAFEDLPSMRAGKAQPALHLLAEARKLFAEAHLLEELINSLREAPAELSRAQSKGYVDRIMECYEESAKLCDEAGLSIRGAHARVTKLRRSADDALRSCRFQFSEVRKSDAGRNKYLLERSAPGLRVLPDSLLPMLRKITPEKKAKDRIPSEALLEGLRGADVTLGEDVTIFSEATDSWVISDGFDRYHACVADGALRLLDLTKQPIPFSNKEAELFYVYAQSITDTCDLYMDAIRGIRGALGAARTLYERMTDHLRADVTASGDNDLSDLCKTTEAILKELRSRHYPLLSTLHDRIRYACSLLEMFQMRTGSVRLGTLFSTQCRLVMINPSYDLSRDEPEDELLEVGADPIFQTTVDFLFRGAKGEEDRKDFQTRALNATITTIDQEKRSLLAETRWIDLDPTTRKSLLERLACHRYLVLALQDFTELFIAQSAGDMATDEIRRRLHALGDHLRAAIVAFDASGEHRSKLIDRTGLEAIHSYMDGIGLVLMGMNQRSEHTLWRDSYRRGLESLHRAKRQLAEAGDIYLLPLKVRDEYLQYVEARILTVEAFRARYRGEETGTREEFAKSAENFEKSATIFNQLGDYRVATKAIARAIDSQSFLKEDDERRRHLQEANANYAASGNEQGFNETMERLRREFPPEPRPTPMPDSARIPIAHSVVDETVKQFGTFLVKEIGRGGMAIVYESMKDDHIIAIKTMLEGTHQNPDDRKRFVQETKLSLGLNHPNIVHVYEEGEIDGVPFFLMERLYGEPLEVSIAAKKRFSPRDAARIAIQIAEALDYAHLNSIFHRDLKPSNIMLIESGRKVKIMDFGIAVTPEMERLTEAGMVVGTPPYMSPERLGGYDATRPSDLYALGVILYEMLTGEPAAEPLLRIAKDHPLPSATVPDLPPALDAIVARLLARDPSGRYESARKLLDDLKTFVGPEG